MKPEAGQRVTFHVYNHTTTLTGKVVEIDEGKDTVTLKCGRAQIPVFADKGYFTEAAPLEYTHTKDYALEMAKKYVGKNGFVFFAQNDKVYRGPIVAVTPTYAIQKTSPNMMTLHRVKDLVNFDDVLVSENREVVIHKTAGMGTISVEPQRVERVRDTGWSR